VDDQEFGIRRVAKPFGKGLGMVLGDQVERRAQENNEQQRELAIFHAHTPALHAASRIRLKQIENNSG
jgi:hypothetical protein